ncbi:MAG TPA: SIS domain-containing protein [Bryobacteraceae bacterium]
MENPVEQYASVAHAVLDRISRTQADSIAKAAVMIADTVARDRIVYTFGSGHSALIATEFYYRAGGMACFDPIPDRAFGKAEHLEGYAAAMLEAHPMGAGDSIVIISNSGRNPLPIEVAQEARKRGVPSIGITALDHSRQVSSRHSSGKKLYMLCDVVIDTCAPLGDAVAELGGGQRAGAVSTLAGAFIASSITVRAAAECLKRGLDPKLFVSANTEGGKERNQALLEFVRTRTRGL